MQCNAYDKWLLSLSELPGLKLGLGSTKQARFYDVLGIAERDL